MPRSQKPAVIEKLFNDKWDAESKSFRLSPTVTLVELSKALTAADNLSNRNPANFFKDFVRNRASANKNWPRSVWERGFTARQSTGNGNAFEFIRAGPTQSEPFPIETGTYPLDPNAPRYTLQSVSLPPAARLLGRKDESWLAQVAVQLLIIESHIALHCNEYLSVNHLQMGVKQRESETDSLYLACKNNGEEVIITVEAKGRRDDILVTQLVKQVKAVIRMPSLKKIKYVLPMAMKTIGDSLVYVRTYSEIPIGKYVPEGLGVLCSEAVYTLKPNVPGIQ